MGKSSSTVMDAEMSSSGQLSANHAGVLLDRAKTSSSGSIGCDEHVRQRGDGGHSEKTHPVPGANELHPPGQIAPKFHIEADRVMWRPKDAEQIDHAAKEGPTGRTLHA